MGKQTYWKSSRKELDGYIRKSWAYLGSIKSGKESVGHGTAIVVCDTITEMVWFAEELRERLGMAKRESKDIQWQGFVDVKLTSAEKDNYVAWDAHDEDLWILMVDAIGSGHKLSVTFNKQNDQFVASFTGQAGTKANEGFTLSAYAKSWYDAVRVLMFKHAVLLNSDWAAAAERTTDYIG